MPAPIHERGFQGAVVTREISDAWACRFCAAVATQGDEKTPTGFLDYAYSGVC